MHVDTHFATRLYPRLLARKPLHQAVELKFQNLVNSYGISRKLHHGFYQRLPIRDSRQVLCLYG